MNQWSNGHLSAFYGHKNAENGWIGIAAFVISLPAAEQTMRDERQKQLHVLFLRLSASLSLFHFSNHQFIVQSNEKLKSKTKKFHKH